MGIARKLEQRIEHMVDGLSAAIFRGNMTALECSKRVIRHADLAVEETVAGPTVPNIHHITINPRNVEVELDPTSLGGFFQNALEEASIEEGWRTSGPHQVTVVLDESVATGSIGYSSSSQPGPRIAWGQLIGVGGSNAHPLSDIRTLIGRSSDADVTIDQPEVSRKHAVLFRKSGLFWVTDLGSANGTTVNGTSIGSKPAQITVGSQVAFGPARYLLRVS